MSKQIVQVPDIGGSESVEVIEVCVAVGDTGAAEDSLIVLESDKAPMEIPSPLSGKVVSLLIKEGDSLSEGDNILEIEVEGESAERAPENVPAQEPPKAVNTEAAPTESLPAASSAPSDLAVAVPDIGGSENVDVIEICVAVGDEIAEGDSVIVLESDKASMEIPSPASGTVKSIAVKEGVKLSEGDAILVLEVAGKVTTPVSATPSPPSSPAPSAPVQKQTEVLAPVPQAETVEYSSNTDVYAGPAVRKLARQLGVDLTKVKAGGPRGRMTKDDVRLYVKSALQNTAKGSVTSGSGIPAVPEVDFSRFGDVERVKMSKIKKLTAANMSRNWLNVPHVTQFDDADITDLEVFRKSMKAEAEKAGVKLTPLPFLIKACAAALKAEPSFNVSLHADGEHIVQKRYINIGIAVDTPIGLMVPVIRDVDKKGLYEIAEEMMVLAKKARDGKLMPKDMQGGCFTISSLGAMGGKGFTPIVNAPEVAILGVSKASVQPVWDGKEFQPRNMLPLCLSYDHRAINGGDAGRFMTYLVSVISEIRRLLV